MQAYRQVVLTRILPRSNPDPAGPSPNPNPIRVKKTYSTLTLTLTQFLPLTLPALSPDPADMQVGLRPTATGLVWIKVGGGHEGLWVMRCCGS